jgi:uncharacterized protein (TIRG00374 family)
MFKGQDLSPIIQNIKRVNKMYLTAGFISVIVFVCCEAVIIKYLLAVVKIKWPLYKCIRYSFVGFFFSCITPSATGGQPAQIYYMHKEGLDIPTSTIILMLVTIQYKFVLVFIGGVLVLFGQGLISTLTPEVQFYLLFGLGLNVFCVIFMSFLVFWPNIARFLMVRLYMILYKLHIIKKIYPRLKSLKKSMDEYQAASNFLKQNKMSFFNVFGISLFQRLLLFYVTYIVYKSFGLSGHSALEITLLQAIISISVDMLPLPGGMGISEHLFSRIFVPIFGSTALTLSAMLISRGISYYGLILISATITIFTHIITAKNTPTKQLEKRGE